MLKHLLSAAVLTVGLGASSAHAAILDITEILSFTDGGFTSSLIHDQSRNRMSGSKLASVKPGATGTFNTTTGDISFSGSIKRFTKMSTYTATGSLFESATRTNGLYGSIKFSFLGDLFNGKSLTFHFDDATYTTGKEPNGYASNGTHNYIALWGDTGKYGTDVCKIRPWKCAGIDLRIAYEDNGGGGGVVPLPASLGFLLAGMGGLGVARKLRKKT